MIRPFLYTVEAEELEERLAGTKTAGMAGVGIAAAIGFVFALTFFNLGTNPSGVAQPDTDEGSGPVQIIYRTAGPGAEGTQELKKFSSTAELESFLQSVNQNYASFIDGVFVESRSEANFGSPLMLTLEDADQGSMASSKQPAPPGEDNAVLVGPSEDTDFSGTNVQVKNVDEPDFIKTDGKYVYILYDDKLTIVNAHPADQAEIIAKVGLDIQQGQSLQNMFLNGDRLAVFYQEYSEDHVIQKYDFAPYPIFTPRTHMIIVDISDMEGPELVKDYEINGNYHDSRMIGDRVYLVTNSEIYDYNNPIIPFVRESSSIVVRPDIYYFDNPEQYYSFNTITSVDINSEFEDGSSDGVLSSTFMMNPSSTIYVSEDSMYITYQKNLPYAYQEEHSRDRFFDVILPQLPKELQDRINSIEGNGSLDSSEKWGRISDELQTYYNTQMTAEEREELFEELREAMSDYEIRSQSDALRTVIHRIDIGTVNGTSFIDYGAKGEVPGRLLNQFSMDESGDRFRLATTSEIYSRFDTRLHNNVYVLDRESMRIVGDLEGIAPDESIYSARFLGDRLYLVTFERIDPFFVIDLSEDDPVILGELKLPGYSSYLHPYDENHIIGVGKETKEVEWGVQTLGVKVALFNVSDVENPELVDAYEIGGEGTDTEIMWNHKAFLFDKEKNVLSIPITMNQYYPIPLDVEERPGDGKIVAPEPRYFQGFYVFGVDPENGFTLKGDIDHTRNSQYYGGSYGSRSFYIEDILYTVTSGNMIKMNSLSDLDEINEISLESTGELVQYVD